MQTTIRPLVFWPTFLVLLAAVVASYIDMDAFLATASALNDIVLERFSWLFSLGSLYLLLLAVVVYVSPLGRVRIGNDDSRPLLSPWRWFSITLSTTLAVGVLFWTTAEPLYHLHAPPSSLGIVPGSDDARLFAMSVMFLHWTFTPYAIYAMPALLFALVFYNLRARFSIASLFEPLMGPKVGRAGGAIDAVALFALVAGMASTLGTGALTIVGGVGQYLDGPSSPLRLAVVIAVIVVTFVLSAASGLNRGIAKLASLNAWLLLALGLFMFLCGPSLYILGFGIESLGAYFDDFFRLSLFTGTAANDDWAHGWSIFYWAVWFAWAPVTALFLGKISRGYTVRQFLRINLLYPALFVVIWISIFSGSAIYFDSATGVVGGLYAVLNERGVEQVLYTLFGELPLTWLIVPLLLFIAYISYVTVADSNTDAIGNLCTRGLTADSDLNAGMAMKIVWGCVVGVVAWVMVSFVGIDGVKMLSNLGGLPAMLMILVASGSLWRWIGDPSPLIGFDHENAQLTVKELH